MKESDYVLTVIEENAVPLASAPQQSPYFGWAIAGIVIVAMTLMVLVYCTWYRGHMRRINSLRIDLEAYNAADMVRMTPLSILHPREFLEIERELEQQLAGYYVTESS